MGKINDNSNLPAFDSKKLSNLMVKRNIGASQLEKKTGIHKTTISHLKNGSYKGNPGIPTRKSLADAFGLPVDYFDKKEKKKEPALPQNIVIVNASSSPTTSGEIKKAFLNASKEKEDKSSDKAQAGNEPKTPVSFAKLKKLPSKRVDDCFATLNENLIEINNRLFITLDSMNVKINHLQAELDELKKQNKELLKREVTPMVLKKPLSDEVVSNIRNYIDGYDANDDYAHFSDKIKTLCSYIRMCNSSYEKDTSVLSAAYRIANADYGLVMEQVRKEYLEDTGEERIQSNLIAIYHQEIYRSILYAIIADMALTEYHRKNSSK